MKKKRLRSKGRIVYNERLQEMQQEIEWFETLNHSNIKLGYLKIPDYPEYFVVELLLRNRGFYAASLYSYATKAEKLIETLREYYPHILKEYYLEPLIWFLVYCLESEDPLNKVLDLYELCFVEAAIEFNLYQSYQEHDREELCKLRFFLQEVREMAKVQPLFPSTVLMMGNRNDYTLEKEPMLMAYEYSVVHNINYVLPNERLFGVELEFNLYDQSLYDSYPLLEIGLFKQDPSVDGEYVTVPLSYQVLTSELHSRRVNIDKLLKYNGSALVGMHVHVSKSSLTREQMGKIIYMLNDYSFQEYWEQVAGRSLTNYFYCQFLDDEVISKIKEFAKSSQWEDIFYLTSNSSTRYVLFNTKPEQTCEFRMFKSPSSFEGVVKNLKVVKSILDYTESSSEVSIEEYKNFVRG